MKPKINKTWLLIVVVIVANIIIFNSMSKKLESVVFTRMVDSKIEGL